MAISRTQLAASAGDLAALNEVVPVQPGLPALKQYLSKVQKWNPSQTINGETFDTLEGKSDWRPARRGHMPYLAIPRAMAHALFDWGTVASESAAVDAAGPTFNFSQAFLALCIARKASKGDAWAEDEKATLLDEVKRFSKRTKGLREAMAQALGLGSAEAVSLILRGYKREQANAQQVAAGVTHVRGGKKVVNQ